MGILSGAMSVRRFRVMGDRSEGWRDTFRDRLNEHAFKASPVEQMKEEVEGWVQVHNLLDTGFDDFNRWLYNDLAVFALRVDKKRLPAKLFSATLAKQLDAWKQEHEVERVPSGVKDELKERLENEWLKRTLPSVQVTEACWNLEARYLVLHGMSDAITDRFRKRFYRTFGMRLLPWSPLDYLDDTDLVDDLLGRAPTLLASADDFGGLA